jgi:hypothetical protein
MPKRGKDKKKRKKKSKDRASISGGELTLLVGKQGLNAPRATSLLSDKTRQLALHNSGRRSLNPEGIALNLEGNDLNPDMDVLNLATADEAAWQFFGDDLLQSDEDELTQGHPGEQLGPAIRETASASSAVPMTWNRREAPILRETARLEEGGDKDPDYEVRYDGDTSEDSGTEASGLDVNLPSETTGGDLNLPSETTGIDLNLPSETTGIDLNLPATTNAPDFKPSSGNRCP